MYVLILTTTILAADYLGGNAVTRTAVPGFEDQAACETAAEEHVLERVEGEVWYPAAPDLQQLRIITTTAVCHPQASEEVAPTMSGGVPVTTR